MIHLHPNRPIGERVGGAKLTAAQIPEIRRLFATGVSKSELGRRFRVSPRTIHYIVTGKIWRHVPDAPPANEQE